MNLNERHKTNVSVNINQSCCGALPLLHHIFGLLVRIPELS